MSLHLKCPICSEGILHPEKFTHTISINNTFVDVPHHSHWCDYCGSSILLSEDATLNAEYVKRAKERLK